MSTHGKKGEIKMNKLVKIPLMALGGAGGVFAVLFTVYFFNLDLKFMTYCVAPILEWNYDRIPRKQYV